MRERHGLAHLEHDLARVERLPGGVGRTDARAAPADRARVGVQQLLPREVLDHGSAERLQLRLHEVGQRLHRPLRALAVAQVHVHGRREHVAQLGGGDQHQQHAEPEHVEDPQRLVPRREVRLVPEQVRQRVADERPLLE